MSAGSYGPAIPPDEFADSFSNVNPFSEQVFGGQNGLISSLQNFMGGSLDQPFDPSAFMGQFMGAVPGLQGITTSATSDLARQQQDSLQQSIGQAVSGVGGRLSNIGALNSSAFPRLVGEALAPEISRLNTNLSSQRLGLFGNLAGTSLPLFAQGNQARQQFGLQAAGQLGQIGAPDMVAPDTVYTPSAWEQWGLPLLQTGLGAGATAIAGA